CSMQGGVLRPPPQVLVNQPGLVTVIVQNQQAFALKCPFIAHVVDVGSGKLQSAAYVSPAALPQYLPPNPADPKSGRLKEPCPRMALFFTAPLIINKSDGGSDGGTGGADPCGGNPMMPGEGGSSGLSSAQAVKIAQEADSSREAALAQ